MKAVDLSEADAPPSGPVGSFDEPSVAMLTYSTKPRGSVVCAVELAEALHSIGCDVTLYAPDKDGQGFYREVHAPVQLIPTDPAPIPGEPLVRQRIAEIETFFNQARLESSPASRHNIWHGQDCLVTNALLRLRLQHENDTPTPAPSSRARGLGMHAFASGGFGPVLRTLHHLERFESDYLAKCQRDSLTHADAITTVSRRTHLELWESYGLPSQVVPNGVSTCHSLPPALDRVQTNLTDWDLPPDEVLVLSVGGVEPRKHSLTGLRAFVQLLKAQPNARWLIAGGASALDHSEYRVRFEAELSAHSPEVQERVHRLGVISDEQLRTCYQAASVLLQTSTHEGWGLCVLEAMSAGTPVVTDSGPPYNEYLDDSCAWLVNAQDPTQLANAMADAIYAADQGGLSARIAAARRRVKQFDWKRSAARYLELYRELLGTAFPSPAGQLAG